MARKLGLTLDDVVSAATAIADADGLEGVTMASVAARLGVKTPSLYAHVDGLAALRRTLALAAARALADALQQATVGRYGADAIRSAAYAYRAFAAQSPGLYGSAQLAADPADDPELAAALYTVIVPVLRAISEAGVKRPDAHVHLTRALRSALHGFVHLERHGGFGLPADVDESFRRLVDLLLAGLTVAADPVSV